MLKQSGFINIDNGDKQSHIARINVVHSDKLNLVVHTYDKICKIGEYNFNTLQLIDLVNAIREAWIEEENVRLYKAHKNIEIVLLRTEEPGYERNLSMNIRINNKCLFHAFNLDSSRKLHQMLAQIINNKKSQYLI